MQLIDKTSCTLRICLEPGLDSVSHDKTIEVVQTRFAELFAGKDMTNVSFDIVEVEELQPDKTTGKFRIVLPPEV